MINKDNIVRYKTSMTTIWTADADGPWVRYDDVVEMIDNAYSAGYADGDLEGYESGHDDGYMSRPKLDHDNFVQAITEAREWYVKMRDREPTDGELAVWIEVSIR